RAAWQRRLGLRVTPVSPRAARRLAPVLPPRIRLAVHFPDDHRVNNERLAVAVGGAARRAGVVVRARTSARATHARAGPVAAAGTDHGRIATRVAVNAAGAWAADVGVPSGVRPPQVFPVRGQMLVLRGFPEGLALPLYSRHAYLVPRLDGRILLGSTRERAGFEKRVTMGAASALLAAAVALAPRLAGARPERGYAGLRPATPDELPIPGAR